MIAMTKRFFLPLFIFSIVIFVSCNKENNDETFDYKIEGLDNLKVIPGGTLITNLTVEQTQGNAEDVSLKLDSIPEGVISSLETPYGTATFVTALSLSVPKQMKMGNYRLTLKITSPSRTKSIVFNLLVDDQISMVMLVYDATQWTPDRPTGELTPDATVNVYANEAAFLSKTPSYTSITDKNGKAYLYHMLPGNYLFTVEKGSLSNIAEKISIDGQLKGFATTGIFQTKDEVYNSSQLKAQIGQLRYRDLNADDKITDADRTMYDMVMVYDRLLSEKVIWIGQ